MIRERDFLASDEAWISRFPNWKRRELARRFTKYLENVKEVESVMSVEKSGDEKCEALLVYVGVGLRSHELIQQTICRLFGDICPDDESKNLLVEPVVATLEQWGNGTHYDKDSPLYQRAFSVLWERPKEKVA